LEKERKQQGTRPRNNEKYVPVSGKKLKRKSGGSIKRKKRKRALIRPNKSQGLHGAHFAPLEKEPKEHEETGREKA